MPLNTLIKVEFYLKSIGSLGEGTTFTGKIFGVATKPYAKIIEMPFIDEIFITDNGIASQQLFEHIQVKYLYEYMQMDIRGAITPNFPFTDVDLIHPFVGTMTSIHRFLLR